MSFRPLRYRSGQAPSLSLRAGLGGEISLINSEMLRDFSAPPSSPLEMTMKRESPNFIIFFRPFTFIFIQHPERSRGGAEFIGMPLLYHRSQKLTIINIHTLYPAPLLSSSDYLLFLLLMDKAVFITVALLNKSGAGLTGKAMDGNSY